MTPYFSYHKQQLTIAKKMLLNANLPSLTTTEKIVFNSKTGISPTNFRKRFSNSDKNISYRSFSISYLKCQFALYNTLYFDFPLLSKRRVDVATTIIPSASADASFNVESAFSRNCEKLLSKTYAIV